MTIRNLRYPAGLNLLFVFALAVPSAAQNRDEQRRQKELQEALQREARPVVQLVNELQKKQGSGDAQAFVVNPRETEPAKAFTAATPPVDPKGFDFRFDTMKAAESKVYAPYTLTIPADAVPAGPVSVYLRLTPKGSPAPPEELKKEEDRFPFEDFFSAQPKSAAGEPLRLSRAFAAAPGDYDLYLAVRPRMADPRKGQNDPVRVVAFKEDVTLPNYWTTELMISSVVVTSKVETIQGAVTPEVQRERPYLFGQTEFVPSLDNKFGKADELSVVFQIYNPVLEGGKPDVQVEYSFHQKLAEGEKYFNKTTPQQLNAQTLPPALDVAATQMLPGGQSVPLASFPPGDYRMEIKVTDKFGKKTITHNIPFTVAGS